MRDPKRIDKVLRELRKLWKKYPELRLGQLLINATYPHNLYAVEDDKILQYIKYTLETGKFPSME